MIEDLIGRDEYPFAGGRQKHFLIDAIEESDTQLGLNVTQLVAQRGLRQKQSITCPGDATFLGDRSNQTQVPDFQLHIYFLR
jgi:hypothetical protein